MQNLKTLISFEYYSTILGLLCLNSRVKKTNDYVLFTNFQCGQNKVKKIRLKSNKACFELNYQYKLIVQFIFKCIHIDTIQISNSFQSFLPYSKRSLKGLFCFVILKFPVQTRQMCCSGSLMVLVGQVQQSKLFPGSQEARRVILDVPGSPNALVGVLNDREPPCSFQLSKGFTASHCVTLITKPLLYNPLRQQ